jgi:phosphatidylinositol alpha 1,6-mannosyltransferase
LVIVGSGPAEAAIRRAVPDAAYLGQRGGEDLATIYASLDVFVHSGPHDTFGQTLQEAAASGLPVIAPAAGGPLDLVKDGTTGFLVQPGDATAMADAVGKLVADPQLREAQSLAAREMVVGRSWPVMCDELLGHYEAVLAAHRQASGTAYAAAEELPVAAAGTSQKTAGARAEAEETPRAEVAA